MIVVTDGIENCGGDPCAVAAELKQKGVDFTAHVVGPGAISAEQREDPGRAYAGRSAAHDGVAHLERT